jgi:predicted TIM-barrel fold metal-dependent hydrolase
VDFERTRQAAEAALRDGFAALLIPSQCPRTHSQSHTGLLPLWAMAEEAGVPIVFHVGGGGELLDPMYFQMSTLISLR